MQRLILSLTQNVEFFCQSPRPSLSNSVNTKYYLLSFICLSSAYKLNFHYLHFKHLGEIQCEVNGQFRILDKEVPCNLYRSPNTVRIVKYRNSGLGMWPGGRD